MIPFRVRIGVTGHRLLPEPERLARSVRAVLDGRIPELFDRPVSPAALATPFAFTLLTPLAEGADRLVATVVMKLPGSELEAVLPLTPKDYMGDFLSKASKAEFGKWLKRAHKAIILGEGLGRAKKPQIRKRAYQNAGRFVVEHCDILIALWDGKPSRGSGGTAEIVAYAREKGCPLIIVSTQDPEDIRTEKGKGLSSRAWNQIAYFNQFPVSATTIRTYVASMDRHLFQDPEGDRIPEAVKSRIRDGLLPWYVRASLIAKQNQRRYLRAGLVVYCLSPLAVAAVAAGILIRGWSLAAFLGEFIFLMVIYAIIRIADKQKVHKKWIESRFLTERIRGAAFLYSCGLKPAALHLPPLAKTALHDDEGILRLFDEIIRQAGPPGRCPESTFRCCTDYIRSRWIGKQVAFHASKATKAGKISRILERTGQATFLAAMIAAAWHIFWQLLGYEGLLSFLEKPAVFLAVVFPAVGAAIGGIRTHREYARLEKRSRFMVAALKELDQRYAAAADFEGLKTLLLETERLMLQETEEWLMLMKFARMEAI